MSAITMDTAIAADARAVDAAAPRETPYFAVRDIHAYYGESYIVQGVSLDMRHSEILALLGTAPARPRPCVPSRGPATRR